MDNSEKTLKLSADPSAIRNVSIIGDIGHGKSALARSLLGDIAAASEPATSSGLHHDQSSVKMAPVSFCVEDNWPKKENKVQDQSEILVNLIDCPGHLDFVPEVAAALRVTDGALVVVDVRQGWTDPAEHMLRRAMREGVRPALVMNKFDALLDLNLEKEEVYQMCLRVLASTRKVMSQQQDPEMDLQVRIRNGTVAFASASSGWAFTLSTFADFYAEKFGVKKKRLEEALWGNNYFNTKTKKWSTEAVHGEETLERAFNQLILDPIYKIRSAIASPDAVSKILSKLDIKLTPEDAQKQGNELLAAIMATFLPFKKNISRLILQLPSPLAAQKYRTKEIYQGSLEDGPAKAMQRCDANGPLVMYVCKMLPQETGDEVVAFGRVFSGKISRGLKVLVYGPGHNAKYSPKYFMNKNSELFKTTLGEPRLTVGDKVCPAEEITPGNLVLVSGFDRFNFRTGTVTNTDGAMLQNHIVPAPLLQYEVLVEEAADLPQLTAALEKISKSDSFIRTEVHASGAHVVAGMGTVHLESVLRALKVAAGVPLTVSGPFVRHRESITAPSQRDALAKSPSKHNRLYMTAEPLDDQLARDIESGIITDSVKYTDHAFRLGHDGINSDKIWAFGPQHSVSNILLDQTKGVQYLNEIRDSCLTAFEWATRAGPLAEEPVRSTRFNLVDVTMHGDSIHRGGGQIIPTARRVIHGSMLLAKPVLLEPVSSVDVTVSSTDVDAVKKAIDQLGDYEWATKLRGSSFVSLKTKMALRDLHGFQLRLRDSFPASSCQASFHRWRSLAGWADDPTTPAGKTAIELRKRKGLEANLPVLEKFIDKL